MRAELASILSHGSYSMTEPSSKNDIFLLKLLVAFQSLHQFGVGFVGGSQLGDASFQIFDVLFGSLTDRSLSLSVICPLPLELRRRECGDAASAGS